MSTSPRTRECSQEKNAEYASHKSRRICIPIENEEYQRIISNKKEFREYLDKLVEQYPELFPSAIQHGYVLHGLLPMSKKMPQMRMRRIEVQAEDGSKQVFTIAPSFVMPYMTGHTQDVEDALFLRKFDVPYWALARVFGHNAMYWERLELQVGRNSIVGTTVRQAEQLPVHLLADEKHTRLNGEKAYVATTVGSDCVLGASIVLNADADSLKEGYGHFKEEAQDLVPDYAPETVNVDGWEATHSAWQGLFPSVTIILCFLHAFLKIRDRCKRMKDQFADICKRVWEIYHAADQAAFLDQIDSFQNWATQNIAPGAGLEAMLKLCNKATELAKAYDHPSAYRTSNMLDRHMNRMDRSFYSAQYFHGHLMTAEYRVRAWALLHNFQPYCPRAGVSVSYQSPAHKLNGFVYHKSWLQNLLVSASMGGWRQ